MFRRYFQPSGNVLYNQFLQISSVRLVYFGIAVFCKCKVVAHTAADERFLDSWQTVDGMVYLKQTLVVVVEIFARGRVQTRRALAFLANVKVVAVHVVHVCRWPAKVGDVTFEVRHLCNHFSLVDN